MCTPPQIGELYEANLAEARAFLVPAGVSFEDERPFLRRAHKMAVEMTKKLVGDAAWRRYRDSVTRLGAPEFAEGEMRRRTASGALRVDRLPA